MVSILLGFRVLVPIPLARATVRMGVSLNGRFRLGLVQLCLRLSLGLVSLGTSREPMCRSQRRRLMPVGICKVHAATQCAVFFFMFPLSGFAFRWRCARVRDVVY